MVCLQHSEELHQLTTCALARKQVHVADPEEPCHSDTVPISRLVNIEQYRERLHDERRVEIAHDDIERAEHPLRGGGSQAHAGDCGIEAGGQEELDQAVENDAKPASARHISFRAAHWVRLRAILSQSVVQRFSPAVSDRFLCSASE